MRLLQILAFCSPGPISMRLLYSDEMNAFLLRFDEALSDKLMLGRVIGDISRLALVKVDSGANSLQIHRLVQAVIRSQMSEEEQIEARHEAHKILVGARPRQGETDDPANWSTYDIIWPHLRSSNAEECHDSGTRQLLIDWVRYQWKHGEFEPALALADLLYDLWTSRLGPDHQQTLHLQFQKANVLRSQGRFSEAREALDMRAVGAFRESVELLRVTWDKYCAVLGDEVPETLRTAAVDDLTKALDLVINVKAALQATLGKHHPNTLVARNNLACYLRAIGRLPEALQISGETLGQMRQRLGGQHPLTLSCAVNLANCLADSEDLREAEMLERETIPRLQEKLGPRHPDTLACEANLAVTLHLAGHEQEAKQARARILNELSEVLGPTHPDATLLRDWRRTDRDLELLPI